MRPRSGARLGGPVLALALALAAGGCRDAAVGTGASLAPLQGTWQLALDADQRRQLRVMRYVLQVPTPSDEALLAAGFRDDEARTAVTLLREIRAAPDGPRVRELRAMAAQLEDTAMRIEDDQLRMQVGTERREGRLELVEVHGDVYRLRTTDAAGATEALVLTVAPDGLVLGEGGETLRFVRP